MDKSSTVIAPTNIAVIKYWGKRSTALNLPINSSISVTLDWNDLRTVTTSYFGEGKDRLFVNGKEVDIEATPRTKIVINEIRKLTGEKRFFTIVSENSFPTAAGLASSAAGYAAMVASLSNLCGVKVQENLKELSIIARQGSGSACRSLMGGFVAWNMGHELNGMDSCAEQIAPPSDYSNLSAIICVASEKKKKVSSTSGMNTSVATSTLLAHRSGVIVPARFNEMKSAVRAHNYEAMFELTMKDSNQFHACCLDTFPPIFYMNDVSKSVISVVESMENYTHRFGYTFDAGPNAVVFCKTPVDAEELLSVLIKHFPPRKADLRTNPDFEFVRGRSKKTIQQTFEQFSAGEIFANSENEGDVQYFFHTGIGEGVKILSEKQAEEQNYKLSIPVV